MWHDSGISLQKKPYSYIFNDFKRHFQETTQAQIYHTFLYSSDLELSNYTS
jgi:hypothetical protein